MKLAMDIRLYMARPGEGWEFTVRRLGEIIAASDGDDRFEHVGQALKAALLEAQASVKQAREGEQ